MFTLIVLQGYVTVDFLFKYPTHIYLVSFTQGLNIRIRKINSENKQRIHDVLLTDLQRRIFKQYNERKDEFNITDEDYDVTQTLLVDSVLHCETLNDVNELLCNNVDLFDDYDSINVFTLDGTMNYIFKLLR